MSLYGKVAIVVTGVEGLEKTALYTQKHFAKAGQNVPILNWSEGMTLPEEKPYILILPEKDLASDDVLRVQADVIVIKNISSVDESVQANYLKLYAAVGGHMNTVVNADDRASLELVASPIIKKTRYFYFSKNKGVLSQIKNIGGVVSSGDDIVIFGFNMKKKVSLKSTSILSFEDEVGLLSSLGAVITVGLNEDQLFVE